MSEIGQGIGRKAQNRRVAGKDPDKRRQILDGAQAVFATRGFDAASMSDIAAAAGVSKSTLYVYFEDKEHLFVALIQQERAAQTQGLFELLEDDRTSCRHPHPLRRKAGGADYAGFRRAAPTGS